MGLTILGIGVVYSVIFKHPVDKYLPFLATGLIVWSFFAGVLNDLATTFVAADVYIRSYPAPKSVLIFRTIVRNLVSMAHNLVILPILWLVFGLPLDASALLFFPGAILCLAAIFAAGLVLAPLCARFRDLPQIVQNTIQLLFFVSPVLFRPQQLGEELKFLSDYNPLANMLELLRGPLLGQVPELHHYLMVLLYAVVGYTLGFLFYARFRARIIYWL
jgi:ABC-type polysaccharide/polyol phosphate export permease